MRYLRRVIKIAAIDSPNVALALRQQAAGLPITREEVIPGLLTWDEYQERLRTWNEMEKCIGLGADFYEGREIRLFTDDWLNRCAELAVGLQRESQITIGGGRNYLGLDPAEGGDNTSWAVVNSRRGLTELIAKKTPDTAVIPDETIGLMHTHRVEPGDCGVDLGGGGREHVDTMRRRGYNVRGVAFRMPPESDLQRGMKSFGRKVDIKEERYACRNLRAQLYYDLAGDAEFPMPSHLLNRNRPNGTHSLRFQLSKFPRLLDDDGRYWLPSKGNLTEEMKEKNIKTLIQIIGCSPDEADAVVVAYHMMRHPKQRQRAGAA